MEESESQPVEVPAGWYSDPQDPGRQRYWNGSAWTEHVSPATVQPSVVPLVAAVQETKHRNGALKTVLAVVGGLSLLIVVAIASCAVPLAIQGPRLDKESRVYADQVLPEVVTTWDQQALEDEMSPECWQVTTDADIDQLFVVYRRLGKLKSLGKAEGQSNITKLVGQETRVTAVYRSEAEFDNGSADITLTLIKHGTTWQVAGFNVNSEQLFEDPQ